MGCRRPLGADALPGRGDKAVVAVDVLDAPRSDGGQLVGVPLEGNGGQGADGDMGVAGVEFPAGGDTVPPQFAPDGGENRFAPTGLGLLLLVGPLACRQPQCRQADDHAGEDGEREAPISARRTLAAGAAASVGLMPLRFARP